MSKIPFTAATPSSTTAVANEFRPRIGSPLRAAHISSQAARRRAADRCDKDEHSQEYKEFGNIFNASVLRKEYANEKLREALYLVLSNKQLYRHTIKQRVNKCFSFLTRWDSDIARAINNDNLLDDYDLLTAQGIKQVEQFYLPFYFSILQELTRNDIPHRLELAALNAAVALQEFAEKQLKADIDATYTRIPQTRLLLFLLDSQMFHLATDLLKEISALASKGRPHVNLNAAPGIELAAQSLFTRLANAHTITARAAEEIKQTTTETQ